MAARQRRDEALDRLQCDLGRAVRNVRAELERIEILAAALHGFSAPVPGYEPRFRKGAAVQLNRHEMGPAMAKDD